MPTTPEAVLLQANALHIPLADQSVHMVLTSPPYWGLRDYQTAEWEGGEVSCDHKARIPLGNGPKQTNAQVSSHAAQAEKHNRDSCHKCGAVRIDQQLGLEKLHDCLGWATGENCGSCYLCHMRAVMQECWRVLRDDGTCWIVIGDSFAAGKMGRADSASRGQIAEHRPGRHDGYRRTPAGPVKQRSAPAGLKPKSLSLIPQRLALALQADGWICRCTIVWNKPSAMPESVADRPTRSHEYVWLLTKQTRYYFDSDAVREPHAHTSIARQERARTGKKFLDTGGGQPHGNPHTLTLQQDNALHPQGRNLRSVWTLNSEPIAMGHFAAFPGALARRCILAGTSAYGVCSVCGKPWVREVERIFRPMTDRSPEKLARGYGHKGLDSSRNDSLTPRGYTDTTTTGWRPTCAHPDSPVVPATVLDPFVGSGTTVLAAHALGRHSIGLDLSLAYLETIAQPRLTAQVQASQERQAEQDAQPDLFAHPAPRWIQQSLFGATS